MNRTPKQELEVSIDKCCNSKPIVSIEENVGIRCANCNRIVAVTGNDQLKQKDAMIKWNIMIRRDR